VGKNINIQKNFRLEIQEILLSKERFLTLERAASWAAGQKFEVEANEERNSSFVFSQIPRDKFNQASLNTIKLSDGVEAVVGVLNEPVNPVPENVHEFPEVVPEGQLQEGTVDSEEEVSAFDKLQTLLTSGYDVLDEEQAEKLAGLKDEFAKQVVALREMVSMVMPTVLEFVDGLLISEKGTDVFAAMLDRVGTNVDLLNTELSKIKLPFDGRIDEDILKDIDNSKDGINNALNLITELIDPLLQPFEDTSFGNFFLLLKSSTLTFKKFVDENIEIEKVLKPSEEMTREQLRATQKERSKEWGIEVVDGAALTFPAGFPTELELYGDPVNLKFPFDSIERAKNARVRFKQFANQIYKDAKSTKEVHTRIINKELEFGVNVVVDLDDELDNLLPANIRDNENVTIKKSEEEVNKYFWVPLVKKNEEERIVFGIVLEPDVVDLHGDTYDGPTVRKAAHKFMEEFQNIGLQHTEFVNDQVNILESYVAPDNMVIDTPSEKVKIKKDTWLMVNRIVDDELWEKVKTGEFTGFSIGAIANVRDLQ
jgi:hypothetical protein